MSANIPSHQEIEQRLNTIKRQIVEAADACGRQADKIQLLAVSKTQAADTIRAAFLLGQQAFGENYLQEARIKQEALSDLAIEWHFIGPIQSNKTREIANHFDWVHTVDRLKIAQRLSAQRPVDRPPLNICIQINIDNEASKSGITVDELPKLVSTLEALPNIRLRGLMAIPAPKPSYDAELTCFQQLKAVLNNYPTMDTLSMGMSGDLKAAITAGSTLVRIGTGIFGKRNVQ